MSETLRVYEPHELGPDGYPFEWHRTIKHLVRDSYCKHEGPYRYMGKDGEWKDGTLLAPQVIGLHILNGVRVEAKWRILTVHHLDGDKRNCRWWNLAALCQRCHLQIQGKVKMHQIYPFEHTPWFRPYAAGYYASSYLRLELTREETEARLEELLSLERVI